MLPVLNSSQGTKVDILNLEESHHAQAPLTLGPVVVTDDEAGYSGSTVRESEAKLSRPQRVQKLRNRGHRRTASTGSNINVNVLPPNSSVKEKDNIFSSNVLICTPQNRNYLNIQAGLEVLEALGLTLHKS